MAKDMKCTVDKLVGNKAVIQSIPLRQYTSDEVGMATLKDICHELEKPGRDPRDNFESVEFAAGVNQISDLEAGMELNGIVTNVTHFGAFVDIGVHQDGLVHISQLADRYVQSPHDVVQPGQSIRVRVMEVDARRKRISLTAKGLQKG